MVRLAWNASANRRYETGLDRGVFYQMGLLNEFVNQPGVGVPWDGLISVTHTSTGGESTALHFDGVKYADSVAPTLFQATIKALSIPEGFGPCLGEASHRTGVIFTRQPRKTFHLSYRTKVDEGGHKIHMIYNALTSSPGRTYETMAESVTPNTQTWKINARPEKVPNRRPTAHFYVDTLLAGATKVAALEDILYGTSTTPPRLPTISELVSIFA